MDFENTSEFRDDDNDKYANVIFVGKLMPVFVLILSGPRSVVEGFLKVYKSKSCSHFIHGTTNSVSVICYQIKLNGWAHG